MRIGATFSPLIEKASLQMTINLVADVDKIYPNKTVYTVPGSYLN